jgi:hypothetical protein
MKKEEEGSANVKDIGSKKKTTTEGWLGGRYTIHLIEMV